MTDVVSNGVTNAELILASTSPRRKYLLEQAGLRFRVVPSPFDESGVAPDEPSRYVRRLAEAKAADVAARYPEAWVIGADTIVADGPHLLGKPGSPEEAREMLGRLSGKTHQVYTGFCIVREKDRARFVDAVCTDVTFKELSAAEIDWYIRTGEPFDKAGAYAIQGMGTFLVRRINGSYSNVVGLPVCEVVELLIREGIMGLGP
jgi:septum formation protein